MARRQDLTISKFFGGIVNDEKSRVVGAALNIEELDIFENGDFVRPAQIFTSDSMPASTEIYSYTSGTDETTYGYGKETSGSKVRIVSMANGGNDNPGTFSTLFTSADATDLAVTQSPVQFFKTDEANTDYLYYITNASGTVRLKRYDISADSESENDADSTAMTLTGLDASDSRYFLKVIFGELYISNGNFIAKVDKDGIFTEKAFTLPNEWDAVDIVPVADFGLIIARYTDLNANFCKGFWWDLTESTQFDDSFELPTGGPQWGLTYKETVFVLTAQNGIAQVYALAAFPGSKPEPIPNLFVQNVAAETSSQPISAPKMVSTKDGIIYFGLNKTDKTGVYAIGQVDAQRPLAFILAKRYDTSDYSNHSPTGLYIQGPNFYAAFDNNGTADNARCETQNSPSRSSNAVYESIIVDNGNPELDKQITHIVLTTKPLGASTDIDVSLSTDYGSYSAITRASGVSLNTTNALIGVFEGKRRAKSFQIKLDFTSNGATAPILTSISMIFVEQESIAFK